MAHSDKPLIRKFDFVVDLIVVGAFFVFIFFLVRSHVPSNDPMWVTVWSAGTAACMSGVFWLALWMLRVVFRYQRELNTRR
jgi:hypothetical protein